MLAILLDGVKGHEKNWELRWPLSRTMGLPFVGGLFRGGGVMLLSEAYVQCSSALDALQL